MILDYIKLLSTALNTWQLTLLIDFLSRRRDRIINESKQIDNVIYLNLYLGGNDELSEDKSND